MHTSFTLFSVFGEEMPHAEKVHVKRHHYNVCPTNHHTNTPYTQKKKLFNGTQHAMKQLVQAQNG